MRGVPKSAVIAVVKPGCPACDLTKPEIAKAKKATKKVSFQQINADLRPSLVDDLSVQAFPDLVYKNSAGKVHHMPWPSSGMPDAGHIVNWIDGMRAGKSQQTSQTQAPREACAQCGKDGHGVSPKIWGPPLWFIIHMVALMYPRLPTAAEKTKARNFFTGLQKVLPCDYCKKHFAEELKSMDPKAFASRDSLFAWTVHFHDKVSARTHSKQPRHSVEFWRNYYKKAAMMT